MRVVSDTSPISNLAVIGRLELLRTQFGEILIPEAVKAELQNIPHAGASTAINQALQEGWVQVRRVHREQLVRLLETGLHQGEAEAIALALEVAASVMLLDERDGRIAAVRLGLQVTGVLGILLRAKLAGEITAVRPELDALRNKAGFFVASRLQEEILRSAGE